MGITGFSGVGAGFSGGSFTPTGTPYWGSPNKRSRYYAVGITNWELLQFAGLFAAAVFPYGVGQPAAYPKAVQSAAAASTTRAAYAGRITQASGTSSALVRTGSSSRTAMTARQGYSTSLVARASPLVPAAPTLLLPSPTLSTVGGEIIDIAGDLWRSDWNPFTSGDSGARGARPSDIRRRRKVVQGKSGASRYANRV